MTVARLSRGTVRRSAYPPLMVPQPGIDVRHSKGCPARDSRRCRCTPTYQAHVWSARDSKRIRKTFKTLREARAWRQDAQVALRRRTMKAPSQLTLRNAAEAWLAGAEDGMIRNRSGDRYKPSALRGYEQALRTRILPELGGARVTDVTRADLQDVAERLLAAGYDPSTIRNTFLPPRALSGAPSPAQTLLGLQRRGSTSPHRSPARNAGPPTELPPICLHEARHTSASPMIAAGVNAKPLSTYMGHSSVTITYDRYGHLMPGNVEDAAALLDAYLQHARRIG